MQRVSPTPLHLAKLILAGSAICLTAYLVMLLPFPHPIFHGGFPAMLWSARLEVLCAVLPFLGGLATLGYNHHRLGSGINHVRFTEDELDEARHFINLPWLRLAQVLVFFVVFVFCVVTVSTHRLRGDSPVLILMVLNPLNSLRSMLRKPRVPGVPIDWSVMKPIRSDHWGETKELPGMERAGAQIQS